MRPGLIAAVGMAALLLLMTAPASAFVVQDKPGLLSATNGMALGPDGNFWIAEEFNGSVVRMSPGGAVLSRFNVGAGPTTVATGPGGRVWVAVTGADKLTWFDATAAAPSAHDVSTAGASTCGPVGLVAGGDGRMYFSMPSDGVCIGNVMTSVADDGSGALAANVAGGTVFDLAVSSGKLFAPDFGGNVVRRFSLGTLIVESTVTTGANPDGITADGAGNIWFTAWGSGRVGRFPVVQNNGAATELIPIGGTLSNPFGIVAAADGNIYVTGSGSQNVARVTPAGTFAFFAAPNTQPWTIVNGPDGDLWFADRAVTLVHRFVNTAPRASLTTAAGTSASTASLLASVDPRGNDTQVVFDYGTTAAYGDTTAPIAVANGADPVPVAGLLTGLAPSTIYHVRVRATNAEGAAAGTDLTFTTLAAAAPPPPPPPAAAPPRLRVTTAFAFTRFATSLIVRKITLAKLAGGETATIRCTGKRCAFKVKTYKKLKKGTRAFGRTLLKGRRLPVGATISVRVTAPGKIGRSTVLKVRRRKAPQITRRCLPPGATSPKTCT